MFDKIKDIFTTPEEPKTLVKDPRGLIAADILFIKKHIKEVKWSTGTSIEEVAYAQGQADLLRFIEGRVVHRAS